MFRLLWSVAVLSLVIGDQLLFASGALSSGRGGQVVCPNKQFTCPDGNTCCQGTTGGTYGCCPLPQAVCCPDKNHCCPQGTTCAATGKCSKGGHLFPALVNRQAPSQPKAAGKTAPVVKQQLKKPLVNAGQLDLLQKKFNLVICPDKESTCASSSTCCKLASGQYACCPLPHATCCSDDLHCCPINSTCDVDQKRCNRQVGAPLPWFSKLPARPVTGGDVICPGDKFSCPSGSTCCKLSTGMWGCCPLPNAVCCSDGRHCCPKHYKCDVKVGTCLKEDNSLSIFWQEIADLRGKPAFEIATICPGSKFKCGKSHKCCAQVTPEGEDQKFSCCPFPGGICCKDNKHCCPKGYLCDLRHLKCTKEGAVSIPIGVNKESFPTDPNYKPKLKRRKTVMTRIKDAFGKIGQALKKHLLEEDDPDDSTETINETKAQAKNKPSISKGKPIPKSVKGTRPAKVSAQSKAPKVSAKSKSSGKGPVKPLPKLGKTATPPRKTMPSVTSQGQRAKAKVVVPGKARAKMPVAAKSKAKLAAGKLGIKQGATVPKTMATAQVKAKQMAKSVATKRKIVSPKAKISPNPSKVAKTAFQPQHRPAQKVVSKQIPLPKIKITIHTKTSVVPKKKISPKSKVLLKPKPPLPLSKNKDPGGAKPVPLKSKTLPKQKIKSLPKAKAKSMVKPKFVVQGKAKKVVPVSKSVPDGQLKKPKVLSKHVPKVKSAIKSSLKSFQKRKINPKAKVISKSGPKASQNITPMKTPPEDVPNVKMMCKTTATVRGMQNKAKAKAPGKVKVSNKIKAFGGLNQHLGSRKLLAFLQWPDMPPDESSTGNGDLNPPKQLNLQDEYQTPAPPRRQPLAALVTGIKCKDGYTCPDETTCCPMPSGGYACCPWPNAVCCADHIHCCSSGQTCDEKTSQCKKTDGTRVPWSEKISTSDSERNEVTDVVCPDKTSTCPDGSTCCVLLSGEYGCCPLPKAVCCSDHLHCCPHGYTCDVTQSKCNQGGYSIPMYVKHPSHPLPSTLVYDKSVVCPDQTSTCPDGSTCCLMSSGKYGCCPLPQAVCCDDHIHCCPDGYTCNVAESKCDQGEDSIPLFVKFPSHRRDSSRFKHNGVSLLYSTDIGSIVCPDHRSMCPGGSTCCVMPDGRYGCCPIRQAKCCLDQRHCCPPGFDCEPGRCVRDGHHKEWLTKTPAVALPERVGVVKCDDGQECPDGSTCCKLTTGKFGCCPVPRATCCPDQIHCCPDGYECDTAQKTGCHKKQTVALQEISESIPFNTFNDVVQCPDHKSTCPAGATCCLTKDQEYGCCPLNEAVCCPDNTHCCPKDSRCDSESKQCILNDQVIPWYNKQPATQGKASSNDIICPDGRSRCPNSSTCCDAGGGEYACCPLIKATCCSDHIHCCPNGYICDPTEGTCIKKTQDSATSPASQFLRAARRSNIRL